MEYPKSPFESDDGSGKKQPEIFRSPFEESNESGEGPVFPPKDFSQLYDSPFAESAKPGQHDGDQDVSETLADELPFLQTHSPQKDGVDHNYIRRCTLKHIQTVTTAIDEDDADTALSEGIADDPAPSVFITSTVQSPNWKSTSGQPGQVSANSLPIGSARVQPFKLPTIASDSESVRVPSSGQRKSTFDRTIAPLTGSQPKVKSKDKTNRKSLMSSLKSFPKLESLTKSGKPKEERHTGSPKTDADLERELSPDQIADKVSRKTEKAYDFFNEKTRVYAATFPDFFDSKEYLQYIDALKEEHNSIAFKKKPNHAYSVQSVSDVIVLPPEELSALFNKYVIPLLIDKEIPFGIPVDSVQEVSRRLHSAVNYCVARTSGSVKEKNPLATPETRQKRERDILKSRLLAAAIKSCPKEAWDFYGKGLAEAVDSAVAHEFTALRLELGACRSLSKDNALLIAIQAYACESALAIAERITLDKPVLDTPEKVLDVAIAGFEENGFSEGILRILGLIFKAVDKADPVVTGAPSAATSLTAEQSVQRYKRSAVAAIFLNGYGAAAINHVARNPLQPERRWAWITRALSAAARGTIGDKQLAPEVEFAINKTKDRFAALFANVIKSVDKANAAHPGE